MGVRVLHDVDAGEACMYDSVTMTAFGPLISDVRIVNHSAAEAVHAFISWLTPHDAREYTSYELEGRYEVFCDEIDAARGLPTSGRAS